MRRLSSARLCSARVQGEVVVITFGFDQVPGEQGFGTAEVEAVGECQGEVVAELPGSRDLSASRGGIQPDIEDRNGNEVQACLVCVVSDRQ